MSNPAKQKARNLVYAFTAVVSFAFIGTVTMKHDDCVCDNVKEGTEPDTYTFGDLYELATCDLNAPPYVLERDDSLKLAIK